MAKIKSKEKSKSKEKFFYQTNEIDYKNSEEVEVSEEIEENDVEDYSVKGIERNEKREYNPEVGKISKRKIGFQIIKIRKEKLYEYEIINFTNNNKLYQSLKNISKIFPWFETITKEKLAGLASDKRTGGFLVIDKNYGDAYSLLLPDGNFIPISSLKTPQGRKNPEFESYKNFREFIYNNIKYINALEIGFTDAENIEEIIEDILNEIYHKKYPLLSEDDISNKVEKDFYKILEYAKKSKRVEKTLKEYISILGEVK